MLCHTLLFQRPFTNWQQQNLNFIFLNKYIAYEAFLYSRNSLSFREDHQHYSADSIYMPVNKNQWQVPFGMSKLNIQRNKS